MAQYLPLKTTEADIDKVLGYLKSQVGWVALAKIRATIPSKFADVRKIEAMKTLGLIERDGENIKPTQAGRDYADADADGRAAIMRERLRTVPLYFATIEWLHHNGKTKATKNDIANYWHDSHADLIGGATGEGLTHPAVFFMRMFGVAGLGKFAAAGAGRETNITVDAEAVEALATGTPPEPPALEAAEPQQQQQTPPPAPPAGKTQAPPTALGTALNVNVEIHIAADAKPATVEEIFKNMRKYLVDAAHPSTDGG